MKGHKLIACYPTKVGSNASVLMPLFDGLIIQEKLILKVVYKFEYNTCLSTTIMI